MLSIDAPTLPASLMGLSEQSVLQDFNHSLFSCKRLNCFIRGNKVIVTFPNPEHAVKKALNENSLKNLEREKLTGRMSKTARKTMLTYIERWSDTIEYQNKFIKKPAGTVRKQLVFLTLTLSGPQLLSDKECKRRLLVPFLQKVIYHSQSIKYIWKAEAQDNGNIHFHLLVDEYLPKARVMEWWNSILKGTGHTEDYARKTGHHNPPSTRIEAPQNIENVSAYCAEYIAKDDKHRPIDGRLWGCSDAIRNLKTVAAEVTTEQIKFFQSTTSIHRKSVYVSQSFVCYNMVSNALALAYYYLQNAVNESIIFDNMRHLNTNPVKDGCDIYMTAYESVFDDLLAAPLPLFTLND